MFGPLPRLLAPATFRELFRLFGEPVPRESATKPPGRARGARRSRPPSAEHTPDTLDALFTSGPTLPDPLAAALATIASLSSPDGHRALLDAIDDVAAHDAKPRASRAARSAKRAPETAAELAARLVLEAAEAPTGPAARALARARVELVRKAAVQTEVYELLAAPLAEPLDATRAFPATLAAQLDDVLESLHLPRGVTLHPVDGPDGPVLHVDRGDLPVTQLVREGDGTRALRFVPAARDVITVSPRGDRLTIRTTNPRLVPAYARVLSALLHGNPRAFGGAPTFSLRALAERGRAALSLPSLAAEVAEVRVVAIAWDSGERETITYDGVDCMAAIERDRVRLGGRHLTGVTLRVVCTDGRRLTVTVQTPWCVALPHGPDAAVARRVLRAIGIEDGADEPRDLWALDPWIHPAATLAALFDRSPAALRASGVLRAHQSRAVGDPAFPHDGRVLVAMPIPGEPGSFYGVSEAAHVPSRSVRADELTLASLDLLQVGRALAKGLAANVRELPGEPGVLELGTMREGALVTRVVLLARDPGTGGPELGERLRARRPAERVVVLVPPGRHARTGAVEVPCDLRSLDGAGGTTLPGAITETLRGGEVRASADADVPRLVLWPEEARAELDGVALTRLQDRHLRLLLVLARSPRPLAAKDLDAILAPKRAEGATRDAKFTMTSAIEQSFHDAKQAPPHDHDKVVLREGGRGYRLGVSARIVEAGTGGDGD